MFRVGLAMDVVKNDEIRFTLAADALRPTDNDESVNFGAELAWNKMLFLRGGFKSAIGGGATFSSRENVQEGISLGAGLRYQAEGIGALQVDYAFSKFGLFGNLNSISLAVSF
jgi:hypothetical protein